MQKMIIEADYDNNGCVTFEEFIPLMTQVIHENKYLEEEIIELFAQFGNDKSLWTTEPLISYLSIASNNMLSVGKESKIFK